MKKNLLNLALVLPFVVLSLFSMVHHEPCRDEVHDFVATTEARSWIEVYQYMRNYASSGPLLFLLMGTLSRVTHAYWALAALSWAIALSNICLLTFFAPFKPHEKVLLSLSYFLLYDYCIYVGRPYGLTILLIFIFLAVYPRRHNHPRTAFLLAALPALAGPMGLIISIFLTGTLILDFWRRRQFPWPVLISLPIILAAVMIISPPPGTSEKAFLRLSVSSLRAPLMAYHVCKGIINRVFLPVPNAALIHFPHISVEHPHYSAALALAFLTLLFIVAPRRFTPMLFFWLTAGLLMGFLIQRPGGIRHQGFLMIALFAAVWLEKCHEREKPLLTIPYLHHPLTRALAFAAILILQAWSGLNAVFIDYRIPNSLGRQTAAFLKMAMVNTDPRQTLLATFYSSITVPIAVFLPREMEFYSLELQRFYRYVPPSAEWSAVDPNAHANLYSLDLLMHRFMQESAPGRYEHQYLLLPFPVDIRFRDGRYFNLLFMPPTREVITADESFYIYRLEHPR